MRLKLLSLANIHFIEDEVSFECLEIRASETLGIATQEYETLSALVVRVRARLCFTLKLARSIIPMSRWE